MFDPYNVLVIGPLLCAYTLSSANTLRAWIAVQRLPPAIPSIDIDCRTDEEIEAFEEERQMYRYFAAFFLVLMGLVACVAIAVWWIENYVAFMMIGGVIVYFLCAYFSHIACKDLIGIPLIIHRTNKGAIQELRGDPEQSKQINLMIVSIATCFSGFSVGGAVFGNSDICASVVVFLVIFGMQIHHGNKKANFRRFFTNTVVYVFVAATLVVILYGRLHDKELSKDDDQHLGQWIYVLLLAFPLTGLFAFCLRFDFSFILPNIPSTLEPAMIQPLSTWSLPIGQGAIAPSFTVVFKTRFAFPYFGSAIGAWFCVNVATNVLGVPGFAADYGWVAHAFGVLLLSTPLVIVTILCVAWVRGETERLWEYEELWAYDHWQAQDKKGLKKVWASIVD